MPRKNYKGSCMEREGNSKCNSEFNGSIEYENGENNNWIINPNSELIIQFRAHHKIYPYGSSVHKVFVIYNSKSGSKVGLVAVDRFGYASGNIEGHHFHEDGDPLP